MGIEKKKLIELFVSEITKATEMIFADPANVVRFLEQEFDVALENKFVLKLKYIDSTVVKNFVNSATPMPFTVVRADCPLKVFFSPQSSEFLPPDQQEIVVIRPGEQVRLQLVGEYNGVVEFKVDAAGNVLEAQVDDSILETVIERRKMGDAFREAIKQCVALQNGTLEDVLNIVKRHVGRALLVDEPLNPPTGYRRKAVLFESAMTLQPLISMEVEWRMHSIDKLRKLTLQMIDEIVAAIDKIWLI